jgi:hypothetical protein
VNSSDEQVLFMTTCMETLIVADREALKQRFKKDLQESALPPLNNLESKNRKELFDSLKHATRNCLAPYEKGKKSFELPGLLNAKTLRENLPSLERTWRMLDKKL